MTLRSSLGPPGAPPLLMPGRKLLIFYGLRHACGHKYLITNGLFLKIRFKTGYDDFRSVPFHSRSIPFEGKHTPGWNGRALYGWDCQGERGLKPLVTSLGFPKLRF